MGDRVIPAALFAGGSAVQAFPLGGRARSFEVSDTAPARLDAALSSECSVFQVWVPDGKRVFVGRHADLAGLTPDQMRAALFPLKAGYWTFAVTDAGQADLAVLADTGGPVTVRLLEAYTGA